MVRSCFHCASGNGAGFPATFIVSTVILLFFAVGFTALTPYVEEAGAFFSYVRKALGFPAGIGIAFVALVSYVAIEAGVYGLLGPAGAALFRVASTLSDAGQKPADLLGRAFYPEVVRMDLSTKKPWKLMLRVMVLASGVAILAIGLLLVAGKPLLGLVFGKAFLGAYAPLVILMLVPFLGIFSFPLSPMLYALGRSDAPLKAKLIATAVFFSAIAPLSWRFGVVGAAIALVLGNAANVAAMMLQLRREHRRVRGPKAA